jgi:hypothetical protein
MSVATTHTIQLAVLPPSVNQLIRAHWGGATRTKRRFYEVVARECERTGVPPARGKRRVVVEVVQSGRGRSRDADGTLKVLLDGLTKCGALRDDSPRWCELGSVVVRRGPVTQTTVTLEDL